MATKACGRDTASILSSWNSIIINNKKSMAGEKYDSGFISQSNVWW